MLIVPELAKLLGVTAVAVYQALGRARARGLPVPEPVHVDRATGTSYYTPVVFVEWWDSRPGPGVSYSQR